jgi:predicted nucleic acid-binding protein
MNKKSIVIDANPLLSALLGGRARLILLSNKYYFVTTEHTTWEVKKYIPTVAKLSDVSEEELYFAFDRFPILVYQAGDYDDKRKLSEKLIGHRDLKDVDILALALKLKIPIWSDDKDFEAIEGIELLKTSAIIEIL